MEHLCKQCGKQLSEVQVYFKRKFCSSECFGKSNRGKESAFEVRKCKQCGSELNRRQSVAGRPYCSQKCAGEARKGTPSPFKGVKRILSDDVRKKLSDGLRDRNSKMTLEQKKERHAKIVATRKARGYWQTKNINRTEWNSLARQGSEHNQWKGDDASYSSKHKWAQKHFTKTGVCEDCGITPKKRKNSEWGTHWHSLNYKREREDWAELCQKCHIKRHK